MKARLKLGVLASHPIQYQAPLFRELAALVDLRVFFAHRQTPQAQAEAGFAVPFEWDVDLLGGYPHEFLHNQAKSPDTGHFFGCDTPAIAENIPQGGFDGFLVMGWNLKSYWQAVRACRRHGVPVMVRGDSQLGTTRAASRRLVKALVYPAMLKQFDACLYVGKRNRDYLLHYGVPTEKLFFSPHCIDNNRFAAAASGSDRAATKHAFGFAPSEKVVLFVGKLIAMKRPADVISAIALLRARGLPAAGLVVGDGPLRHELATQAQALDVPVRFAGFWNQAQLPNAYAAADVLVLPSTAHETWGLVVNEALACGLRAVVSDDVGCGPDLVRPGATGEVFATGNTLDLADALQRIVNTAPRPDLIASAIAEYSCAAAARGILSAANFVSANQHRHG